MLNPSSFLPKVPHVPSHSRPPRRAAARRASHRQPRRHPQDHLVVIRVIRVRFQLISGSGLGGGAAVRLAWSASLISSIKPRVI